MDNEDPTTVTNTILPSQTIVPQFAKPALYENFSFMSNSRGLMPSAAFGDNSVRFGGDGSDGILSVSSGTTNIDLGSAALVVKNYSSVSITGTGAISFTNPHTNGTIFIMRSQGNVTLTSTTSPYLDLSGMGAAGAAVTATGSNGNNIYLNSTSTNGGVGTSTQTGATAPASVLWILTAIGGIMRVNCGAGGGGGGNGAGGIGGVGGGGLILECAGILNFATSNGISVAGKIGNPGNNLVGNPGPGGGGGGSGGCALVLYNQVATNTGSILADGGAGGKGGDSSGGAGGSAGGGGGSGASASVTGGNGGGGGAAGANGVAGTAGANTGSANGGAGGAGGTTTGVHGAGGGGGGGAAGLSLVTKNIYFS